MQRRLEAISRVAFFVSAFLLFFFSSYYPPSLLPLTLSAQTLQSNLPYGATCDISPHDAGFSGLRLDWTLSGIVARS